MSKNSAYFYRPQTKFANVMFLQVSVCQREGGGGNVWYMAWSGWCAWQGGMCGRGACVVGDAWQGGMHGRGHAWPGGMCGRGVCMEGGMCGRGACMVGACVHGKGGGGMRATADTIQQNIIFGVWSNF